MDDNQTHFLIKIKFFPQPVSFFFPFFSIKIYNQTRKTTNKNQINQLGWVKIHQIAHLALS